MMRRPPRSTRTDTLFPYTTLFRSFPIAIPAWKIAPALAFGNTVVLKAAAITPAIASALGDVLVEAGIPKGVFNHVFVPGAVAAKLVSDPRVKALSFTRSEERRVGKECVGTCSSRWSQYSLKKKKNSHNHLLLL